jgi:hypothetical protein
MDFQIREGDSNPCCNLLRAKYLGDRGFIAQIVEGVPNFGQVYMMSNMLMLEG